MVSFIHLLAQTMDNYGLYDRYEWIANVKNMMDLGLVSEDQARGYLYAMQPLIQEVERTRNVLPRAPSFEEIYPEKPPDLVFGTLVEREEENIPTGLFLQDNMSLIIAGNGGSGKSTAIYNLVLAINRYNQSHPDDFISVILWESKDGQLLAISQVLDNCVVVSAAQTLRLGVAPPDNVPWHIWNTELGRIISSRGGLQAGGIGVVEMLNFFARVLNKSPSGPRIAGTFENLYEMCDLALPGMFTKEQYLLSVKQVLHQPAKATANLWQAASGPNLEKDIVQQRKHLLIDDRGQDNWVGAMAKDIMIKGLLLGRQYSNQPAHNKVFLLGDEFGNYISRKEEEKYQGPMTPIECFRKGRSLDISFGIGVNALGPISRTALVDANYHCLFRMKDQDSLREAANTLILPPNAAAIFPALQPGEFLFRGPAWPDATLARIFSNLLPPVSKNIRYDTLPFTPSRKLKDMPEVLEALKQEQSAVRAGKLNLVRPTKSGLMDKSHDFLALACEKLAFPASEIFKVLEVPYQTQMNIRDELEGTKLAGYDIWRIGRSDRLFYEVTPAGYERVEKPPLNLKGRGSISHRCSMLYVQDRGLSLGYEHSDIEFLIRGTNRAADVAWYNGKFEGLCLFEIVHKCWNNLAPNIKIAFESGMPIEKLIVITATKTKLKKAEAMIRSDAELAPYRSSISFETITPYLDAYVKGHSKC